MSILLTSPAGSLFPLAMCAPSVYVSSCLLQVFDDINYSILLIDMDRG